MLSSIKHALQLLLEDAAASPRGQLGKLAAQAIVERFGRRRQIRIEILDHVRVRALPELLKLLRECLLQLWERPRNSPSAVRVHRIGLPTSFDVKNERGSGRSADRHSTWGWPWKKFAHSRAARSEHV